MKAVRFHKIGGPEVLVYEDVPDPTPKDGEVLIRIEAVGLNFADVMRRRGDDYPQPSPPPFIFGAEVAGTIAAVGKGVTSLEVGTPVLATPGEGVRAIHLRARSNGHTGARWHYRRTDGRFDGARVDRSYRTSQRCATGARLKRPDRSRSWWCGIFRSPTGQAVWRRQRHRRRQYA